MNIQLPGYETLAENSFYCRPAELLNIIHPDMRALLTKAPLAHLTQLVRFKVSNTQEIVDYIVECARGNIDDLQDSFEIFSESAMNRLRNKDPVLLKEIQDYFRLPAAYHQNSKYILALNHLVSRKSLDDLISSKPHFTSDDIIDFIEEGTNVYWTIQAKLNPEKILDINDFEPLLAREVIDSNIFDVFDEKSIVGYSEVNDQLRLLCSIFNQPGAYSILQDNSCYCLSDHAKTTLESFSKITMKKQVDANMHKLPYNKHLQNIFADKPSDKQKIEVGGTIPKDIENN